jgi:hypothetical protein
MWRLATRPFSGWAFFVKKELADRGFFILSSGHFLVQNTRPAKREINRR